MSSSDSPRERPVALRIASIAAVIVWAEAALLVIFAFLDLVNVTSERLSIGLIGSVFLAAYGLTLAAGGWKLLQWREWTRGLIIATQLIAVGLAWNMRASDPVWFAPVLAVVAIVAIACLISGPVTRAFSHEESI